MQINQEIVIYVLLAVVFLLAIFVLRLEIKLRNVLRGKNAKTLEDSINNVMNDLNALISFRKDLEEYLTNVEKRLKRSIQAVETIRFNPFKGNGGGGNQSFATSFINEKGDGVVLSSLYSRDRVSIFSKPVVSYKSEFELSSEENKVLNKAKKTCKS
ncbi:DUF4446 family protein [Candidatus Nomurabacteria bacterium]|nr:DUF4446 family protein [Candidatus Nomurabacteria bacterium]